MFLESYWDFLALFPVEQQDTVRVITCIVSFLLLMVILIVCALNNNNKDL